MGMEAVLALLVGAVALIGVAASGGGGDDDDTQSSDNDLNDDMLGDDLGDGDFIEEDVVEPEDQLASLEGTAEDDDLFGDELIGDINGEAGDDLLVSFGASGTLSGDSGDDTLVANSGDVTLTGGSGADIFFVNGDEGNVDTNAVITDFNPDEDAIVLTFQQSTPAAGDVEGSPDTVALESAEIETENGTSAQLTFGPRAGFEDSTQGIGFASVILEGVTLDDLEGGEFFVGRDGSPTDDDELEFFDAFETGFRDFETFTLGTSGNDSLNAETDALFGLAGDDVLIAQDGETDLFGGSGNDDLFANFNRGNLFGGGGDDVLVTEVDATLTGGAGADVFEVARDIEETEPTVITDFVVGEDRLELNAVLFDLESENGEPGTSTVGLQNVTTDGVTGTLVTTQHQDAEGRTGNGPSVFLVGVDSADIPAGTFTFDPVILG